LPEKHPIITFLNPLLGNLSQNKGVCKMKTTIFSVLFLLLVTTYANAQKSSDFKSKFGKPVSETYKVQPDILLTANYDLKGEICDILLVGSSFNIKKIAEKIVPLKSRGKQLGPPKSLINAMDCCSSMAYEYEKVTMKTFFDGSRNNIKITFKDRVCVQKQPEPNDLRPMLQDNLQASLPKIKPKEFSLNLSETFGKYETTQAAVLTDLPSPELTPEAIAKFEPNEMTVEAVLTADGKIANVTFRGSLKNGMFDRVKVAVRKIKFTPALLDNQPVSQRITIKYGIKKCENNQICGYAFEFVE
jgi:hypothetical protein